MGCCGRSSRTLSPTGSRSLSPPRVVAVAGADDQPDKNVVKHELVLSIPGCKVHLIMDEGEALELASGDFQVVRISDGNVSLATVVKVGEELQWPLTKDEPVVKLDGLHYLYSLPMKDGKPLSYGVGFSEETNKLDLQLDPFLKENSLFTSGPSSMSSSRRKGLKKGMDIIDWEEFAPAVQDYNSVLAKAIAGGTGQIVRGIFMCSNAYANQVHKGGETIAIRAADDKNLAASASGKTTQSSRNNINANNKTASINKTLKRVRKLSEMTEKMSRAMLDVVGVASGSVMGPVVRSQAGKKLLSMMPGEVLLASLDAVNKVMDAAEAAERQAMTATSGAVTRMVTNRYGESAGEATEDAVASAGHVAGTAWNVVKLRKAVINPASSASSGAIIKNAAAKSIH